MKAVKVTYTVRPEFSEKNIANIDAFLKEVKNIGDPDLQYFVFLDEDGKTFNHLSIYKNDEAQKRFLTLPIFQSFQRQRDESGLVKEPSITSLTLIDSSHTLFQ
jgi:hypothetical protein